MDLTEFIKILVRKGRAEKNHLLRQIGTQQWGTKSFEFWTLLSVLLVVVRPKSVVELGSGRSTSYLTEYAMKAGVPYASIEQNRFYAAKIKRGLRNSFLDHRHLHHVPLGQDGWYKIEKLNHVVNFPCEFLFVDGPSGNPRGWHCEQPRKWLMAAAATSKIIIVDDVHRKPNLEIFYGLISKSENKLSPIYFSYHVREKPNVIAIALVSSAYETFTKVCSEIKIELFSDY